MLNSLFSSLPRGWRRTRIGAHYVYHVEREALIVGRQRGQFEKQTIGRIRDSMPADAVGIDIGANIGLFLLSVVSAYEPFRGRIYGFEANPNTYARLKCTIEANQLGTIATVFPIALSDKAGVASFVAHDDWASSGDGFVDTGRAGPSNKIIVPTAPLDEIVEQLNLDRMDWIKIDVEGAERSVIAGARDCLTRFRPQVIFEAHPVNLKAYGAAATEIFDAFTDLGYDVRMLNDQILSRDGFVDVVNKITEDNFLATPKQSVSALARQCAPLSGRDQDEPFRASS